MGLVARNVDGLNETKKKIEDIGGVVRIFECDLSNFEEVDKLIKEIREQTNHIDLIANIAGIWHGKDDVFAGIDFEKFDKKVLLDTMNVGIIAPMLLVSKLLPLITEGDIINLSGTFENGAKGWLPYYVSKRAIEDFTVGLADELKGRGIKVNCISPSDTATESYKKFFPQYIDESIDPKIIAKEFIKIIDSKKTGKVWVMKKNKEVTEGFHQ